MNNTRLRNVCGFHKQKRFKRTYNLVKNINFILFIFCALNKSVLRNGMIVSHSSGARISRDLNLSWSRVVLCARKGISMNFRVNHDCELFTFFGKMVSIRYLANHKHHSKSHAYSRSTFPFIDYVISVCLKMYLQRNIKFIRSYMFGSGWVQVG